MATRNIVPRANEEGNIGTSIKRWFKGWFKDLYVSGNITDGINTTTLIQLIASGGGDIFYPAESNLTRGLYRVREITGAGNFNFNFRVPAEFGSLVSLTMIGINIGSNDSLANIDLTSQYGSVGESYNQHSESNTIITYNLSGTINKFIELDISSVFSNLSANDFCGINIDHIAIGGSIDYLGIRLIYNPV